MQDGAAQRHRRDREGGRRLGGDQPVAGGGQQRIEQPPELLVGDRYPPGDLLLRGIGGGPQQGRRGRAGRRGVARRGRRGLHVRLVEQGGRHVLRTPSEVSRTWRRGGGRRGRRDRRGGGDGVDPPGRLLRRRQLQFHIVGDRARDKDGHRNDGLGRGGAAVVAGFERPVTQLLVDGEYRPPFGQKHAPAGDQHFSVGGGLDRRAGPAA